MELTIQKFFPISGKLPPQVHNASPHRPVASSACRSGLLSRVLPSLCVPLALCATLAVCPATAAAQIRAPMPPPVGTTAGPGSRREDPALRRMTEEMAKARNSQRQKKIVADTALLLDLAKKLNDEVSHSDKNELSISVVQEAEKIEKLAKSIKEKMRDGE